MRSELHTYSDLIFQLQKLRLNAFACFWTKRGVRMHMHKYEEHIKLERAGLSQGFDVCFIPRTAAPCALPISCFGRGAIKNLHCRVVKQIARLQEGLVQRKTRDEITPGEGWEGQGTLAPCFGLISTWVYTQGIDGISTNTGKWNCRCYLILQSPWFRRVWAANRLPLSMVEWQCVQLDFHFLMTVWISEKQREKYFPKIADRNVWLRTTWAQMWC